MSHNLTQPDKYKPWGKEVMQKALQAVKVEGYSVRMAALLGDRVIGRVNHGVLSGLPIQKQEKSSLVWPISHGWWDKRHPT